MNNNKDGTSTKRVLVCDTGVGLFCMGIFDDPKEAICEMMFNIWESQEGFLDEGDEYIIGPIHIRDDGGGAILEVRYKDAGWDSYRTEIWHILDCEEGGQNENKM